MNEEVLGEGLDRDASMSWRLQLRKVCVHVCVCGRRKAVPVLAGAETQSFGVVDSLWPLFLSHTNTHTHTEVCRLPAPGRTLQMEKQENGEGGMIRGGR